MSHKILSRGLTINHLFVLLLLCFSGNPLFVSYGNYQLNFVICLVFFLVSCAIRNQRGVTIRALFILLPFILISFIHILAYDNTITPILFFSVSLLIGCIAVGTIGESFAKVYVDVMYWLAIFSLICFTFFKFSGIIYGIRLSSTEGVSLVFYTQLLSFGGFYDRNSGMFWEPGAYQGYLNIALLFLMNNDMKGRDKWVKFIVLSLALFSTSSTTGYLVYAVIIGLYVLRSNKLSIPNKVLLIIVLLGVFAYEYNNLDFMKDKVNYESSLEEKEKSRVLDYIYYRQLFNSHPLLGVGLIDMPSGNGFLSFLLSWGVLGTLYFFTLFYKRLRKFWRRQDAIAFIIIIILCLQGEGFLSYPLFLGLPSLMLKKQVIHH